MCFAGEGRSDRTSTIRIVFYLFGSIAGFRPSLRWLRLSGRRPSFAGTVLGFGRIGAGDPATVLADRRSRPSCARSLMSRANTLWGAPRIHGELLKLGFEVAQSTVARYMCRHSRPPSQGWRTFLSNHVDGIAAIDLFVLPTIAFQILYCLVIVRHGRRLWVSFGVTANPTAEWILRQVTEAFPWDHAPRYLIRDGDTSYGPVFLQRIRAMGIRDHPIAPRSPWQNAYVERLIGSIRRECLDHMIVFGEAHLRRILRGYAAYYNVSRTHRSLNKDAPLHRAIERLGAVVSRPVLGGLHHQYCRI
jgi:transposase InsO family protein